MRQSRVKYARIPWDVLTDPRLKVRDIRVYGVLAAASWQGDYAKKGGRYIAETLRCSRRLVLNSLNRLEACRHIQRDSATRGQRAGYTLLSPVFGQKQRSGTVEELVSSPAGHRRLASVRTA